MIEITVREPENLSDREKEALVIFFTALRSSTKLVDEKPLTKVLFTPDKKPEEKAPPLDPADDPSTGADTSEDVAMREMAAAFGAGVGGTPSPNVPPVPNPPPVSSPTGAPSVVGVPVAGPSTVKVDAAGLPWDNRIHSSGKSINKGDGLWKAKRDVAPSLIASVEAELRALMALPNVPGVPATPSVSSLPPVPPVPAVLSPVPVPAADAAHSPEVEQSTAVLFPDFAAKVMAAVAAGKFTHQDVAAACKMVGLANFPSMASRPDYIPQVDVLLFSGS